MFFPCVYFEVSFNLTIALFGAKTEEKYRDVAPLSVVTLRCPLTLWRDAHSQQNDYYKRQDFHPLLTLREENNFLRLPLHLIIGPAWTTTSLLRHCRVNIIVATARTDIDNYRAYALSRNKKLNRKPICG